GVEALPRRALAEELDVRRREVEAVHPIAALAQPDQMRAGAAGDVEHGLDGPPRIGAEAVDEEVHLLLSVHVEGDLVVARRRVLAGVRRRRVAGALHLPHHVSRASRRIQEAVIPVRADGSQAWATSTRSVPTIRHGSSSRTISTSSAARKPHGSGEPVPGASAGSSTSMSTVT